MESVNAGHYDPLGADKLIHTDETKGIPLGIIPDAIYQVIWSPFHIVEIAYFYIQMEY